MSSARHVHSDTATATTANGATCRAMSPSRPAIEPTFQNRNWSSVSVSSSRIADVNEPSSADSAAPASAILTGVAPVRPADRARTRRPTRRRAGEREPHVAVQRTDVEHVDPDHDGQRRAGIDAEDARIGQRVAGQPLHDRARQPEAGADHQADRGSRHAQRPHDEVLVRAVEVGERPEHGADRDRLRAVGDRQQATTPDITDTDPTISSSRPTRDARRRRTASRARATRHGSATVMSVGRDRAAPPAACR